MTGELVPFVLLQARNHLRDESINVGVAAISPWGVRVIYEVKRTRLRAVDPDRAAVHDNAADAAALLEYLERLDDPQLQIAALQGRGIAGALRATSKNDLERCLQEILDRDVRPVRPSRRAQRPLVQGSGLARELRTWFRASKVFSTRADDISRGRIIEHFPIELEADLFADFALRHGALHVIETLDLRRTDRFSRALRNEAAFKSLLLDQVKAMDSASDRIAVVAADDYSIARPAVAMLRRYATDLFAMESSEDRQRFATLLAKRLDKPMLSESARAASAAGNRSRVRSAETA